MKHKRLKLCAIFLVGFGLTGLHAQTSVNATGGNASGSGGSASYSVGQVAYQANTGTSGSVTKGVQQPFEILVVTELDEAKVINLTLSAYPNPATDFIELKVESEKLKDLSYQLFDMNGKLIRSEKITGNKTSIVMTKLLPSAYFIKVIQANKEIKTFKIIKN
ncbi:MAG TPA: T9SS type A sorting domain-containing protein [Bacteroidales bacterium]|nr:T9SS type A sorting domain-containing protein [Bacteroidales bacterium]